MKQDTQNIIIILAIISVLLFATNKTSNLNTIPGEWDVEISEDMNKYLIEEPDFDYSDSLVWATAQAIKENSNSVQDAIKRTAQFVYENVRYSGKITVQYCYDETASSVLKVGYGDCVSMSRLNTALLRAQGIPARTMGGCLTRERCGILFSAVPYAETQTSEMEEGDFKKRGFLHEWVEVWDGNRWVVLESTSAQIFDLTCNTYMEYGYDTNKYNRCVITNLNFWNSCKIA